MSSAASMFGPSGSSSSSSDSSSKVAANHFLARLRALRALRSAKVTGFFFTYQWFPRRASRKGKRALAFSEMPFLRGRLTREKKFLKGVNTALMRRSGRSPTYTYPRRAPRDENAAPDRRAHDLLRGAREREEALEPAVHDVVHGVEAARHLESESRKCIG